MPHVRILASGAPRLQTDVVYFLNRASEERTAALHARYGHARQKHLELAEQYEKRVRAIASRDQRTARG